MNIQIIKHINKDENNRIEFLFHNYDYFDGNDIIAEFFVNEFQMKKNEKIDGLFSSIIKLYHNENEYNLVWHEDVGNYVFSTKQDEKSITDLEKRLELIVDELNRIIP